MNIYTALIKPDAAPVLVREGFSWGAFIFGPVWLAAHATWVAAALSLLVGVLIMVFAPAPACWVLLGGEALLLGLIAGDARRWSLEHRGYVLLHVMAARDCDEAWLRLLTHRPDLATRFQPEPL